MGVLHNLTPTRTALNLHEGQFSSVPPHLSKHPSPILKVPSLLSITILVTFGVSLQFIMMEFSEGIWR